MTENEVQVISSPNDTALYLITKAEVDQQISTAKAFPRSLKEFIDSAESMATLTEEIAQSCSYSMPRGGKPLEGPSVRLAEIIVSSYGNIRAGARVVENDGKTITAQGICHDLEKNTCVTLEVKRRITDKNGKSFSEDMQIVTGNAACAIAFRNAVFKAVPAALVTSIYEKVKQVAKGSAATLSERRTKAVQWFESEGVKPGQICDALGIKKIEDIDLDKLATLSGMRSAIKNGESTIKEMFSPAETEKNVKKPTLSDSEVMEAVMDQMPLEKLQEQYELTDSQIKMFGNE